MVIVYPVFMLVSTGVLLYWYRHVIAAREFFEEMIFTGMITHRRTVLLKEVPPFYEVLGFLYLQYKPEYWYWEIIGKL